MRTLKGVKIGSGKNHITSTQFVTISQNVHEYFLCEKAKHRTSEIEFASS